MASLGLGVVSVGKGAMSDHLSLISGIHLVRRLASAPTSTYTLWSTHASANITCK